MWNMKQCPRCHGDVYLDEDTDRCYEKCLQCGYERELQRVAISRTSKRTEKANRETM
jgi:DNA-directed RNA polymerase subunit M/transcription elongation factor TFIIS